MKNAIRKMTMLLLVILLIGASAVTARRLTYFYASGDVGGWTALYPPFDFDYREPPPGTIYFSLPPENAEAQPGDKKSCAAKCLASKICTHYIFTAVSDDTGYCRLATSGNIIFLIPPPITGGGAGGGGSEFEGGLSGGMFG